MATRRTLRQSRLALARQEAERLRGKIRALEPRVSRIILFGSVARQNPRHEYFDIDLALEGAPSLALLEPEVTSDGFRIDLVQLEWLSVRMRENIEREGVVLYGT
jgi:predicted nucleotidyltransferase